MATNVTSKGQVTIPKNVRTRLGIGPGSAVDFELNDAGEVVLRRAGKRGRTGLVPGPRSRYAKLRGRATIKLRTDEILALTRGS